MTVRKTAWPSVCGIINHTVLIYPNCDTNANYAAYNSLRTAVSMLSVTLYYSCRFKPTVYLSLERDLLANVFRSWIRR